MVGIVLLAMVAAFLALRLYAVLGKRTGHEQTFVAPAEPAARASVTVANEPTAGPATVADSAVVPGATAGVRAIAAADGGFDPERFLQGAQAAYRTILEAFWRGDEEALRPLTGEHVREAFQGAIGERQAAGFTLDNRLVNIERATITDARVDERTAHVTVKFDADIAAVTRDRDGKVVAGSLSDAVPTQDSWTFSRELRSKDPNWLLTDTDESA